MLSFCYDYPLRCILLMVLYRNVACASLSTLRQLHVIFRHGERAPTETYKNDPYINYSWPDGWGQLTKRGKFEMYDLGQRLLKEYDGFIPQYYIGDDVRILSSYADRCHVSAQVLAAGLFPPSKGLVWKEDLLWQPVSISSLPRNQDRIIVQKARCNKYDKQLQAAFKSTEVKKLDTENADLYKYLTEHTGQDMSSISKVELLFNTLEIEELNNLTLPEWTRSVYPDRMKPLASKTLAVYTDTLYMKRLRGGMLIKYVLDSMQRKIENKKEPSIYLYSGHDLTLVNLLRAMGLKEIFKPGFGASFIYELHKLGDNYLVKMIYRDDVFSKPEEMSLSGCSASCSVKDFQNVLQPVIPTDFDIECEN